MLQTAPTPDGFKPKVSLGRATSPSNFVIAPMSEQGAFTSRRLQSMARLASYVLLLEFIVSSLLSSLPLTLQPERLLGQITGLLDMTSLPVLAFVLLYGGLVGAEYVARWEWRLARFARPLLLVSMVVSLLLIPGVYGLGVRIQATGDAGIRLQGQQVIDQLSQFRRLVKAAPDSAGLRRLVEAQPLLRSSLDTPESPFRDAAYSLAQQRDRVNQLLDRISVNLTADTQRRRADAAGSLHKLQLRLAVLALVHGIFFLLAWLIWPRALSTRPPQELIQGPDATDDGDAR